MVDITVLIDDNDIDLFIHRRFLELFDFSKKLISYKSASEAISWLGSLAEEDQVPDIIFLDLNMPNVDGFGFLERFKSLPEKVREKVKIVILTSSNGQKDKDHISTYKNVIHFITKPIKQSDIESLKQMV